MAEIALGIDDVTDALFQFLGAWKSAIPLPFPDKGAIHPYLEIAPRSRNERYACQAVGKGLEQLLRHPARAQQPVALGAVEDGDGRLVRPVLHGLFLFPHAAAPLILPA